MNKIVSIKGTSVELFKKDIYGLNENGTYLITKYSLYVSKDN